MFLDILPLLVLLLVVLLLLVLFLLALFLIFLLVLFLRLHLLVLYLRVHRLHVGSALREDFDGNGGCNGYNSLRRMVDTDQPHYDFMFTLDTELQVGEEEVELLVGRIRCRLTVGFCTLNGLSKPPSWALDDWHGVERHALASDGLLECHHHHQGRISLGS